ncbi:cysteine desulfurase family protein [Chloroflexota bacterium]
MKKAYMDNASMTPVLPEVREVMLPFFGEYFGNPSSLHQWGDAGREALDVARTQVSALIDGSGGEVIFTSCGTESNNLAIKGLARAREKVGKHIVISEIEHFSVQHSARTMEKMGFKVTMVPVDKNGVVSPEAMAKAIRDDTALVSVMLANGEVGTIQPIKEIAAFTRARKIPLHTDAIAAVGNIAVDVVELGVDALSLAANQFYGPSGVGALWVRKGVTLIPLLDGGIQEGGRRSGTENVAGIAGLGKAAEIAARDIPARIKYLEPLRDKLLRELPKALGHTIVTGHPTHRLPGHASFCVEFIEGESMMMMLDSKGIAVSSGSACASKALKASHVLIAMGLSHEIAQGSVLFAMGQDNTEADIDYILEVMSPIVERLRQMSPLYAKYLKENNRR